MASKKKTEITDDKLGTNTIFTKDEILLLKLLVLKDCVRILELEPELETKKEDLELRDSLVLKLQQLQ